MTLLLKAIRWVIVHPWVSLSSIAAITVIMIVSPFGGSTSEPKPEPPAHTTGAIGPVDEPPLPADPGGEPTKPVNKPKKRKPNDMKTPAPDPHDYDPETRSEIERQLREMPALQALPVKKPGVVMDITDMMPDGRPIITVTHRKDELWARDQWASFLRKHKDAGKAYVVLFKKG